MAARTRAERGRAAVGPRYEALGTRIFDRPADGDPPYADGGCRDTRTFVEPALAEAGLPLDLAALDDPSWDAELRRETDEALALTGKDVGTPMIQFRPPQGVALVGPVISRPTAEQVGMQEDWHGGIRRL